MLEDSYELDTLITILGNRLIQVNLQEITHKPYKLIVDSISLPTYWQPMQLYNRHRVSGQPDLKLIGNKG